MILQPDVWWFALAVFAYASGIFLSLYKHPVYALVGKKSQSLIRQAAYMWPLMHLLYTAILVVRFPSRSYRMSRNK